MQDLAADFPITLSKGCQTRKHFDKRKEQYTASSVITVAHTAPLYSALAGEPRAPSA